MQQTTPETDAKNRVRPLRNREIDKAAEALAEKHELPKPPSRQLKWEQMQEWLALLSPEMWTHVMLYLYRIRPRIIRQLNDPDAPKYIDCISQPFDMEYMIARHGGGRYLIEGVDGSKTKSHQRVNGENHLFRCVFDIDEVRYEPKLDYAELDINHRDNMSYIQMLKHRGDLDSKGRPVTNPQPTPQNGAAGVNVEVIKEILGFVNKMTADKQEELRSRLSSDQGSLGKSVGDILLEKMRQDDPNKQVETLSKLISSVKDMYGTNKAADTTNIYAPFIQMLSEQNKTLIALIEKSSKQREPEPPPNDDLDRLDKLLNIADRLRGGGGRRGAWDIGLDYARELGIPLLTMVGNLISLRRGGAPMPMPAANPAAAGAVPGAAPIGAFDPYANPAAMRAYASSLPQQPAPAPPSPIITPPPANSAPAGTTGGNPELLPLFQMYGGLIVNALNNDTAGCDFADYVVGLTGNGTHAMIANQGEDSIVRTMLAIPEMAMFGEVRLRRFTNEFIHYQEILDERAQEQEQGAEA